MNPKIIDVSRYKKTTAKEAKKKKNQKAKKEKINENLVKSKKYKVRQTINIKKMPKQKVSRTIKKHTTLKIVCCVFIIFVIGILSKKIVKLEDIPLVKAFFNDDDKTLQKDYDFKIGVLKLDTTDINSTKNIVSNEIIKMSNIKLLDYTSEYDINYLGASSVNTNDNINFLITLNKKYNIKASDIKSNIEAILKNNKNIYFESLKNIKEIKIIDDESLNIKLKNKNPYFIYSLNFPIYNTSKKEQDKLDFILSDKANNSFTIIRNKSESSIKSVKITNFNNVDSLVDNFKSNSIDMFITSSDSTLNLIGKYEYNIKKFRNGETVFLLGNKDSNLFKQKEVRQAIAYSLNREEICKKVNNSFSEVIDIPYIYSEVKYKYDTYAATNSLLSNGWKKIGGVYTNTKNGKKLDLDLKILVNNEDSQKKKIAEFIKDMLGKNGLKVKIDAVNNDELKSKIEKKEYDLVLASINLSTSPDISFLNKYLDINTKVDEAIKKVEKVNSDEKILSQNIKALESVLSDEIACIGILAYDTDVIYQKNIVGFDNLKYMNIFDNFVRIGKLSSVD